MELLSDGLVWWIFISVLFMGVLIQTIRIVLQRVKKINPSDKHLQSIFYFGGLAFLTGVLSQIIGIIQALNAIIEAADISFEIVIQAFKKSFYLPCFGLIVFIISLLFALLVRNLKKENV
jgi:hypothetical protein